MLFQIECYSKCYGGLSNENDNMVFSSTKRFTSVTMQKNLLFVMLADQDESNRKIAVDIIKKICNSHAGISTLRQRISTV